MEKQNNKMEIMFDWFLGEAKDLTDKVQKVTDELAVNTAKMEEAANALNSTVETAQRETVAAQRELADTLRQAIKANTELASKLQHDQDANNLKIAKALVFFSATLISIAVIFVVAFGYWVFSH